MYTSAECHNKKKQKQITIIALIVYFIEVLKEKILSLLEDQTVKLQKQK